MTHTTADLFRTFDLGLAAALVATGNAVDTLDRSNPSRVQFVFKQTNQLDEMIQAYWANTPIDLAPQVYFNALKGLKNQIYSSNGSHR